MLPELTHDRRILHVIHSLDPRSGGPSHAIRQIVRQQLAAGIQVSLLANTVQSAEPWFAPDEYVAKITADVAFAGVNLKLARSYGRKRPWSRFAWSPETRPWLKELFRNPAQRPDVVHIHGTFSHVTSSAAALARKFDIPYIIRPTGVFDRACYEAGRVRLKQIFSWLSLRRDVGCAALIHATSDAEAEAMRGWAPAENVRVVPLGVDPAVFQIQPDVNVLFKRFPQLRDRRIILYLSRVAPKKRCEMLAEAVGVLSAEFPDLILLVAGQDAGGMVSLDAAIDKHQLADRVVKTGFLEGTEKQAAFAAASLFALPSIDENFGIAVVEAMSFATPVLVTPGVASHVHVDESGCGLTVEGTVDDLVVGLRKILTDDRATLGRRGKEYVAKNLTWPSIIERINALYDEAVSRQQQRKVVVTTSSG